MCKDCVCRKNYMLRKDDVGKDVGKITAINNMFIFMPHVILSKFYNYEHSLLFWSIQTSNK